MTAPSETTRNDHRSTLVIAGMASAYFLALLLPSLSPHYGFYSDELYYLACTNRLAFGYVDQPPLFVFLLRLTRDLLGDSLVALRALPALTGGLTAFLAGWMARHLGGELYAQALATLAVMVSGILLVMFSMFTVNCSAILLWTVASWVLLELCRTRDTRLWLALGAVLGLALLNKHTAVVPVAGVAVATLLSPLRWDLAGKWPWLGLLCAVAIVTPNIQWQATNGWPSIAFYATVEDSRYSASALEQIGEQILAQNPATFPIWASGIFFFLRSRAGARFRPLGWFFLTALGLAIVGGSKLPYRIAGAYPVAFAGGAVFLEAARKPGASRLRRWGNTYALPAFMVSVGLLIATLVLPILPPTVLENHPLYDADEGGSWRKEVGTNRIPYHLGNRTHWKAFSEKVRRVVEGLPPERRNDAILLLDYFGHAGALEYYGRGHGLPPVYSPHTGYFLWGPPAESTQTVVAVGIDESFLRANFEQVTTAAIFDCDYCPPWVDDLPIHVATSPTTSFALLWADLGRKGGMDRRRRLLQAQELAEEASDS